MNLPASAFPKPLAVLTDAAIVFLSYTIACACGVFTSYAEPVPVPFFIGSALLVLLHTAVFLLCRVYRILRHGADVQDALYPSAVSLLAGIPSCLFTALLCPDVFPLLCSLSGELLAAFLLLLVRLLPREIHRRRSASADPADVRRLLIIGAGSEGARLLHEIRQDPSCGLHPVGFLDKDPQKTGGTIGGVPVLGSTDRLREICAREAVDVLSIADPSLTGEARPLFLRECLTTGCAVRFASGCSGTDGNALSGISPEELLGREPVRVADSEILAFVRDKTVLITGGGGTIGSELCRKIAANHPKRLIILDIYENNAYAIQQELLRRYGDALDLEVIIATVCDHRKLNAVFAAERPDLVIHAAAHKHVPLMETVPDEAVKNNVFGTFNTVMAARENGVRRMILISTDKAVNPTSIMGATKRICEMIVQYADAVSPGTTFAAVRFGNVLGSNGSVIPLFRQQIAEHRDITVTHPDMIRYFMTISEASQLVLAAGAMADGGEIFVLDMGDPVRIDDLAKNMIRLAGLIPGRDIGIRYTGLRPGEKLYEELLMSEEGLRQTPNRKIFIGRAIPMDHSLFLRQLSELHALAEDPGTSPAALEQKLAEIVPTFRRVPQTPYPSGDPA